MCVCTHRNKFVGRCDGGGFGDGIDRFGRLQDSSDDHDVHGYFFCAHFSVFVAFQCEDYERKKKEKNSSLKTLQRSTHQSIKRTEVLCRNTNSERLFILSSIALRTTVVRYGVIIILYDGNAHLIIRLINIYFFPFRND